MFWFLLICFAIFIIPKLCYQNTAYYQVTHIPYFQMSKDLGRCGEYLIYRSLKEYENETTKFLFNLYIPKGENGTTEIDVLMISPKGLFVFESKNFSGWIFGSEHQTKWYQTLWQRDGTSRKESFYNPIMQNSTHIKHLKALLGEEIPMHSIVVFSEACTFKGVQVTNPEVYVIKHGDELRVIDEICSHNKENLPKRKIQLLYEQLYPYTQIDAATKAKHIEVAKESLHGTPVEPRRNPDVNQSHKEIHTSGEGKSVGGSLRCPRCGGKLILRIAKEGYWKGNEFYGCSNYPRCRYLQNK